MRKAALAGCKLLKSSIKNRKSCRQNPIGAIKGALVSGYKAVRNQEDFSDWRSDMQVITEKDVPYGEGRADSERKVQVLKQEVEESTTVQENWHKTDIEENHLV